MTTAYLLTDSRILLPEHQQAIADQSHVSEADDVVNSRIKAVCVVNRKSKPVAAALVVFRILLLVLLTCFARCKRRFGQARCLRLSARNVHVYVSRVML